MVILFAALIVLIGLTVHVLTDGRAGTVLTVLMIAGIALIVLVEIITFRALDRHLDKTEVSGSRFGREFSGNFKGSPGPYGQNLRNISGKNDEQ